jgi:hypothetical protein
MELYDKVDADFEMVADSEESWYNWGR